MEDGIFPGSQSIYNQDDLQEERRLAYVGITRAKEQLYLIKASSRMLFGQTKRNLPSRFLKELPVELTNQQMSQNQRMMSAIKTQAQGAPGFTTPFEQARAKKAAQTFLKQPTAQSSTGTYTVGMRVRHGTFGEGTILDAVRMGNDTLLEIAFDKTGTKKLMANYAKLVALPD